MIIGAGGGKVLDTARATAADLELPVVNCPTVASSDAPCSALSVVYTEQGEFDKYIFYNKNPELYQFQKTLEAYRGIIDSETDLVLSTDADLLKFLRRER